jgi:Ca-activated chloride channel family protein
MESKNQEEERMFSKLTVRSTGSLFMSMIIGIMIFTLVNCGGGGGGGSSSPATPNIEMDNSSVSFGDVVQDKFSNQTITIKNTGSANLAIGQIAKSNPLSAPFSISADNCSGAQVPPSKTCTLQVRFSPTVQGPFQDAFDIPSNDPLETSVTVSVSGYGRGLNVVIDRVYTDNCPTVGLLVTVTDKDGNPLAGLANDSFSLLENGAPKAVGSVAAVKSPVSVSLAMDYSTTMVNTNSIPGMETAAKGFIDLLKPANHDEAEVIKFAGYKSIYRMIGFTSDQAALKAAIEATFPGDITGTAFYEAVWLATDDLAARSNLRALVVVSDGKNDYLGGRSLDEVIALCKEKGVHVFTIGLGNVNAEAMQLLASQTGGEYFFAPTTDQLEEIYLQIAAIITGQYLIEYDSSSSGAGAVNLSLEAVSNNFQGRAVTQFTGCP